MSSRPSACKVCGQQGRYGWDDDWCQDTLEAALACPREGWYPGKDDTS